MVSAEVHSTAENVAPKKKQLNFLVSFTHIAEGKKKNRLNTQKEETTSFSMLLLPFIHKLLTYIKKKTNFLML